MVILMLKWKFLKRMLFSMMVWVVCATAIFNFNNPQEVHEGKYLVYVGVNAGAPSNYFFTYQMTEVDQHLLCVPTHGPGEDRENILQYYAIFDSLFPRILMHTLRN